MNSDPRRIAESFLADVLPRRWSHTIGVASVAAELADILAPEKADTIVAAVKSRGVVYDVFV